MPDQEYLLIHTSVLPEVFLKVVEVKRLIDQGEVRSINQAVKQVGISRSAYYKYVNAVRVFDETRRGDMFTLLIRMENYAGVLPRVLDQINQSENRLVTLHQDVAIKGISTLVLTLDSEDSEEVLRPEVLTEALRHVNGVIAVELLT
ncbi:MAG TPA: ACT domain-containing protein [Fastidiosipila sp.]|nr:ACT domain-containing protein [Fastidiosipila sp.]